MMTVTGGHVHAVLAGRMMKISLVLGALLYSANVVQMLAEDGTSTAEPRGDQVETTTEEDHFKCTLPEIIVNGSDLNKSQFQSDYTWISEVKFPGIIGPLQERLICKIKCVDGQWVGPLCATSEEGRYQPIFRECTMQSDYPYLTLTFKNNSILLGSRFAHGSIVQARCKELGTYKLLGENSIMCANGEWTSKFPTCIPTSILTNFTEDAPPTILINVPMGSASVEPSGELSVYPDSTVHLDCIVVRRAGSPEWSSTISFHRHRIDWSPDSMEKDSHYRLILDHMTPQDSGIYTCATPHGVTNSITIHVVSMQCESMEIVSPHITYWMEGNNVGQVIRFSCPVGFRLNGTANITCQGSGQWSASPPICVIIFCPRLSWPSPQLSLVEHNASYGGRAVFRCAWGYKLAGPPGIECDRDGNWTGAPPTCLVIQCPSPLLPANGELAEWVNTPFSGKYGVGDLVQYKCHGGYNLTGEASIVCTETGFWSHPPPFCILPNKFTYKAQE
ncbi:locomotion-related protein hikaru genki isoform X4 [Arctopsyche grandis]|uniref:locomotion-related protein hikaru genki isoform X4 n=2 Tax=Arctopsyche grandis TaxID=121162 RepID=UPI00406D922C